MSTPPRMAVADVVERMRVVLQRVLAERPDFDVHLTIETIEDGLALVCEQRLLSGRTRLSRRLVLQRAWERCPPDELDARLEATCWQFLVESMGKPGE